MSFVLQVTDFPGNASFQCLFPRHGAQSRTECFSFSPCRSFTQFSLEKLLGMPSPTLQHATSSASCLPGPACCHQGTWQLCHSQTVTQIWRALPSQAAYFYVSCACTSIVTINGLRHAESPVRSKEILTK